MFVSQWDGQHGRAHWAGCLKDPFHATGFGTERLNQSARASHEEMAVENGRLRERDNVAIEAIGPLQLEARYFRQCHTRRINGLITRVGGSRAPSVPFRFPTAGQLDAAIFTVSARGGQTRVTRNPQ